ncbi:class-II aminoacyl-tRNA synthetase family protein [Hymenobacter terrestris]|uniref:Aminoacyl-tRNA synthetase class II (D/K/N) domain-containing protein n=1 Tax=Hymenobacter terrestris TaxID=2748310 RepID=A0ABX2Q190_9BACT|nr:amino acid--tRNA ligase-related protein [Hymenobacter terrestris]NVO83519.1 hypothetical protein [Hymenobacter terrestris]
MNDDTTFAKQIVAAAPTATRNVNPNTGPRRMAVIEVWDAMMRGVRKLETSSMLEALIRQGIKLSNFDWYLDFHKEHDVKLHSGAGVGMARVAQFILGQNDIRVCVPFLINRENVI